MHRQKVPLRSTHAFSEIFLTYQEEAASLQPFYSRYPRIENFGAQIKDKAASFPATTRTVLVEALTKQYGKISKPAVAVTTNIQALAQANTFTVTTGHQLNIFTGPLYFIYKIITVINACKELKRQYPENHFVPVYWMASEDHDYEEIKYFRLYGKKYTWETQQQGAVGLFNTAEIKAVLQQLPGDVSIFQEAYSKNNLLSDAVRHYVNVLFGNEGLVVLDANDANLKRLLQPVMREDIFNEIPFKRVTETNQQLTDANFTPPINPREINFFYLDKSLRSRIEKKGDAFIVVDTDLTFSRKEIETKIQEEPAAFSPNVILRPLYQEMILPNLAYVGGPAELVYWLELKGVFQHFHVPFPMLMPRNFALVLDIPTARKLERTGMEIQDFFEEKNYLFNHWVSKNSTHNLSLGPELQALEKLMAEIQERCAAIDTTLGPMAKAESTRMQMGLEKIEKKMMRAEKRLHEDRLRQIGDVKDHLFPNGGLQERTDNFLNFYQQDPDFINRLLKMLDPFDFRFHVLTYE
jgi:bacillithiol biosynthesis cysteine-adding enzyme BshC